MPPKASPEKVCTWCGRLLPRSAYTTTGTHPKTGTVYVASKCKKCNSMYSALYQARKFRHADPATRSRRKAQVNEATRRYRERLKGDPDAYEAYLEAGRARNKAWRLKGHLQSTD